MNRQQIGDKQMIASPNGGKALLIFKGRYKKMFIDNYIPSPKYFDHIKGRTTTVRMEDMGKKKPRLNLNKVGTHFYLIGLHLSALFNVEAADPDIDDSWLDDTEEMKMAKARLWENRRHVHHE
jgi:hypothetical protein